MGIGFYPAYDGTYFQYNYSAPLKEGVTEDVQVSDFLRRNGD